MTKVSIIIPCYNEEKYVAEAIESALNQTYTDIEIVCVNDASTDSSGDIIKSLVQKHSNIVYVESKKNEGLALSRNKGIEFASGDYILPLDADDLINKDYIRKAVDILDKNPDVGVVYSFVKRFQDDDTLFEFNFNEKELLYQNCLAAGAVFRKSDFIKVGAYNKFFSKIGGEDWDLWLSFYENGYKFYKIPEIMYYYRFDKNKNNLTSVYQTNINIIRKKLLERHFSLYLNSEEFIDRIFNPEKENLLKFKNKASKYKKLFNIFLIVALLEILVILLLIFLPIVGGGGFNQCFAERF